MRSSRPLVAALTVLATFTGLVVACAGEVDRIFDDELAEAGTMGADAMMNATDGMPPGDANPTTDGSTDGGIVDSGDGAVGDGAVSDGACGATNTIANCGACGNACDLDSSVAAPSCNGTSCLYACKPGRFNCNNAAPDTNGCECVGTGCCPGGTCQTAHSNGVGQTFYDCNPLGTYNQVQAIAACTANVGDASSCFPFSCTANAGLLICSSMTAPCNCWKYDPGNSGINGKVSTTCACPNTAGATPWN